MNSTLDHVAFVVRSLERAIAGFGLEAEPPRSFPKEGTRESYLGAAGATPRVLLIQPEGDHGPYAEALRKRGAGLHHLALRVDDLQAFVRDVVDGSGWLVHPRALAHSTRALWLARPGVEALVELYERGADRGPSAVGSVQIAGLDQRPELLRVFAGCGVEVSAGPATGITLAAGGRLICSPEHPTPEAAGLGDGAAHNRRAWNRKL